MSSVRHPVVVEQVRQSEIKSSLAVPRYLDALKDFLCCDGENNSSVVMISCVHSLVTELTICMYHPHVHIIER